MDEGEAMYLSKILVTHSQKYFKHLYGLGILTGAILTVLILKWLS
jgi:hypothetical protein